MHPPCLFFYNVVAKICNSSIFTEREPARICYNGFKGPFLQFLQDSMGFLLAQEHACQLECCSDSDSLSMCIAFVPCTHWRSSWSLKLCQHLIHAPSLEPVDHALSSIVADFHTFFCSRLPGQCRWKLSRHGHVAKKPAKSSMCLSYWLNMWKLKKPSYTVSKMSLFKLFIFSQTSSINF